MQIAVLFRKVDEGKDLSCYTIHHIAELWRKSGLSVIYVFGVDKHVPADLIIVHIDFSIVPQNISRLRCKLSRRIKWAA